MGNAFNNALVYLSLVSHTDGIRLKAASTPEFNDRSGEALKSTVQIQASLEIAQ